jgi:hypothetical protein
MSFRRRILGLNRTTGIISLRILSVSTFVLLCLIFAMPCIAETIDGNVSETATPEQQAVPQMSQPQPNMQSQYPQAAPPGTAYGNAQQMGAPQTLYGGTQASAQYDEQGHRIVGVLGAKVDMVHGFVQAVFPPSSLNQWGIHPGDRVLGYDYHPWVNGWDMEKAINAGPPGAVMQITILHDNRMLNIMAPRVDSRALVGYDRFLGNNYFEKRAKQSQY